MIDTAKGVTTAKVYYALKETPTEQVEKTVSFSGDENWTALTIDGTLWRADPDWAGSYYSESEGIKNQITCVDRDISDTNLQWYIESRLPTVTE